MLDCFGRPYCRFSSNHRPGCFHQQWRRLHLAKGKGKRHTGSGLLFIICWYLKLHRFLKSCKVGSIFSNHIFISLWTCVFLLSDSRRPTFLSGGWQWGSNSGCSNGKHNCNLPEVLAWHGKLLAYIQFYPRAFALHRPFDRAWVQVPSSQFVGIWREGQNMECPYYRFWKSNNSPLWVLDLYVLSLDSTYYV